MKYCRCQIKGEVKALKISAESFDPNNETLIDYEMEIYISRIKTECEVIDSEVDVIYFAPALIGVENDLLIETGRKYTFDVYMFGGNAILLNFAEL